MAFQRGAADLWKIFHKLRDKNPRHSRPQGGLVGQRSPMQNEGVSLLRHEPPG